MVAHNVSTVHSDILTLVVAEEQFWEACHICQARPWYATIRTLGSTSVNKFSSEHGPWEDKPSATGPPRWFIV